MLILPVVKLVTEPSVYNTSSEVSAVDPSNTKVPSNVDIVTSTLKVVPVIT